MAWLLAVLMTVASPRYLDLEEESEVGNRPLMALDDSADYPLLVMVIPSSAASYPGRKLIFFFRLAVFLYR